MLEKNKQEVSDINSSVIQQANGDINIANYGLGYNDVREICHDIMQQKMAIFMKEATDMLKSELSSFKEHFYAKLAKLDNPLIIEKLKTPKLQFILHTTMKEYAQTDDIETKEELIDLIIDRLKVDETSPEIFLIDTAIELLPKINKKQCYFLGALTSRMQNVVDVISESKTVQNYLKNQGKLYQKVDKITNLDIQYLKQINCCTNIIGQSPYYSIISILKKNYDLLFRHPCPVEKYNNYIKMLYDNRKQQYKHYKFKIQLLTEKKEEYDALNQEYKRLRINKKGDANSIKEIEDKINNLNGIIRECMFAEDEYNDFLRDILPNSSSLVYKEKDSNYYNLRYCSKKSLENALGGKITNACYTLIDDLFFPFSDFNIEQYLVALNKNWDKTFDFFKRNDILNIDLTPIGAYIGRRIITRVTKIATRSIEEFYNYK